MGSQSTNNQLFRLCQYRLDSLYLDAGTGKKKKKGCPCSSLYSVKVFSLFKQLNISYCPKPILIYSVQLPKLLTHC